MIIDEIVFKNIIDNIKRMMFAQEEILSHKIKGHDWSNGYSCACHDFRTRIIDEVIKDTLSGEHVA